MSTKISPLAGKPAPTNQLVNVSKLVAGYYDQQPDPSVPAQWVAFGTSGHRGSSFDATFKSFEHARRAGTIREHDFHR